MTHKGVIIKKVETGYIVESDEFDPLQVFTSFPDLVDWLMRFFDADKKVMP
jgi:hypothetical protein